MKKILAVILVLVMAFSLFACSKNDNGGEPSDSPSDSPSGSTTPSSTPSAVNTDQVDTGKQGEDPLDLVGFYDPNYDYNANKTFVVKYLVNNTGVLFEQASDAFAYWAGKMNVDYQGIWSAGGDKDLFLSTIPTFANQVDGFIVDPDSTMFVRVDEIMKELNKPWIALMSPARDLEAPGMPLIHPFIGFDHYVFGVWMTEKLLEFKNELWPDVPLEEFGFITVDFSIAPPLHDRERGAHDTYLANGGIAENYFVADTSVKDYSSDTSSQLVSAILTANPQFDHWLIAAEIDDMAMGAATSLDQFGYTDNSAVVTIGGSGLQIQWDSGIQNAWRAARFTAQVIYAEGVFGALYAFMSGQATPETIWPSWVNVNDPGYAGYLLPSFWIEYDNYKHYLKWSDVYSGYDYYPQYSADGISPDDFLARQDIPDYYTVKN